MGPLAGVRVVEVAGIGPGPFCGMMLSDMGAEVISVERFLSDDAAGNPLNRNRHQVVLDLKTPAGVAALLTLVDRADVIFEGFRPGVAERLGFGPEVCLTRNPGLVYGRMTGWGQEGPLAGTAGHDINYIALSGALKAIGRPGENPAPPLNLVGDFGGGGMFLAFGIACALFEARRSGKGQVVDAAMVDGAIALMGAFMGPSFGGPDCDETGRHLLAGAAHCYDTYETADGQFIAVAPLEPQFYDLFIDRLGLDPALFKPHGIGPYADTRQWSRLKSVLADLFKTRTRDEWCRLLEGTDACVAPVLSLSEAPEHPHNRARGNFVRVGGRLQNAPAPRFSRTPSDPPRPPVCGAEDMAVTLTGWGLSREEAGTVIDAARWS